MSLKSIARETLAILDRGYFDTATGHRVDITDAQREAVEGTRLLRPMELKRLFDVPHPKTAPCETSFSVTGEKTQEAARRIVQDEGVGDLVILNFASARNPGGGFIGGAKAQEEDLARSSGIYRCLLAQPAYYDSNRARSSLLYTDNMIYSPKVPWFRVRNREVLDRAFHASIITAPAPNAGEYLRKNPGEHDSVHEALVRRSGYVLALAEVFDHRSLLLGAWGCGVFRNCPDEVADAFMSHLESRRFKGYFDRVVFAVFDPSESQSNLRAFEDRVKGIAIR